MVSGDEMNLPKKIVDAHENVQKNYKYFLHRMYRSLEIQLKRVIGINPDFAVDVYCKIRV